MSRRLLVGVSVLWIPLAFLFDGLTVLVLPVRLGGDPTSLGLVSLLGLGIAAGLQPVAGWLSDRLRSRVDRRVFIALAALPVPLGLIVLLGTTGLVAAVIGYVLVQVAGTVIQAGQQTLIPEHVRSDRRGRAAGLKAAFDVGGAFIAFLVLGALLATGAVAWAGVATGAILLGAVALVFTLVPPTPRTAPAGAPTARVTGPPVAMPRGLVPLVGARFLFLFGTYAVGRFLVLLVAERLGIQPERAAGDAGGLLAIFTLATAAAALASGAVADRRDPRLLMSAGGLLASVGILLFIPSAGLLPVLAGGLAMSAGTGAFMTANWAATTQLVPPGESGRLMALANLGTGLAAAAAGVLGPLIDSAGFTPALLIAAGASAAALAPIALRPWGSPARGEAIS